MSPTTSRKSSSSWQDNLTIALGIWLLLSPAFLQYSGVAPENWVTMGAGGILVILMIGARLAFHVWEEWLGVVFGALIAIAPWIAGFTASTRPTVNCVVCGLAVMVLTGWRIFDYTRHHGEMTA